MPHSENITIVPLQSASDRSTQLVGLDAVFFETSPTRIFASDADRQAFRDQWLGRYIDHFPELVFLALNSAGTTLGYVVGSSENPARDPRFTDIAYFHAFAELTEIFPAHLHINLTEAARNRGIGGLLIAAFAEAVRARGASGVHVVTSEKARNRPFYNRQGFDLKATAQWLGNPIVFLARPL